MLRLTFISLWVIGWICMTLFVSSLDKEFGRKSKQDDQEIVLQNPALNKLIITTPSSFEMRSKRNRFYRFDSFDEFLEEDTLTIQNIKIGFLKSPDSIFHVRVLKEARGFSREKANENASKIIFNAKQVDSLLVLDDGITINKYDKFRNQNVIVTIYVPVGKQVRVNKDYFKRLYFNNILNIDDYDRDNDYNYDNNWQSGEDYVMKEDGRLYNLNEKKESKNGHTKVTINGSGIEVTTDNNGNDNYRYNNGEPMNKLDSMKVKLEKEQEKIKDSLQKAKEKIEKQLEKIRDNGNTEPTPLSSQLPAFSPMMNIN